MDEVYISMDIREGEGLETAGFVRLRRVNDDDLFGW